MSEELAIKHVEIAICSQAPLVEARANSNPTCSLVYQATNLLRSGREEALTLCFRTVAALTVVVWSLRGTEQVVGRDRLCTADSARDPVLSVPNMTRE